MTHLSNYECKTAARTHADSRGAAVVRPYTVAALAERWSCSETYFGGVTQRREIEAFRIGRFLRIPAADVARFEAALEAGRLLTPGDLHRRNRRRPMLSSPHWIRNATDDWSKIRADHVVKRVRASGRAIPSRRAGQSWKGDDV